MQITQKWARSRLRLAANALLFPFVLGCQILAAQQSAPNVRIDLEQAIQMAVLHNHALKAARTQIQQSQAEEVTAAIRPNPVFTYDGLYVPIFSPGHLNAETINNVTEFDVGLSYTFERGHKRQARIRAARDQTAVTTSQVSDTERGLTFNVAQQFIGILLAKSNLRLATQDLASYQETVNLSAERYKAGAISEYAYKRGAASLLDFLDAERSYRATQWAYRQALATYMLAFEQLREVVGTRKLQGNQQAQRSGSAGYFPRCPAMAERLIEGPYNTGRAFGLGLFIKEFNHAKSVRYCLHSNHTLGRLCARE